MILLKFFLFGKALGATIGSTVVTLPLVKDQDVPRIEIPVGSPAVNISFLLDSGSSDMIVINRPSSYSQANSKTCSPSNDPYTVTFCDESELLGKWVSDVILISNQVLKAGFVLASFLDDPSGLIIGLGASLGSFAQSNNAGTNQQPLLYQLKSLGRIKKLAYGLSNTAVTFGGYDTKLLPGQLRMLTLQSAIHPTLQITSVLHNGVKISAAPSLAIIDSGTALTYVSQALYNNLEKLGTPIIYQGKPFVMYDCADGSKLGIITFNFQGVNIEIPLSLINFQVSKSRCAISITPEIPGVGQIVGRHVLRNLYLYADLSTNQISLSQLPETTALLVQQSKVSTTASATKSSTLNKRSLLQVTQNYANTFAESTDQKSPALNVTADIKRLTRQLGSCQRKVSQKAASQKMATTTK